MALLFGVNSRVIAAFVAAIMCVSLVNAAAVNMDSAGMTEDSENVLDSRTYAY